MRVGGSERIAAVAGILCAACWVVLAAAQTIAQAPVGASSRRTASAVTYEARRTTRVDMVGTPLLPRTRGEAKIETGASGPVRVTAKVRGLTPATPFGPEYLTYVLWVIPPHGRPKNLGELRPDGDESKVEATTDVQTFALIVTAEPYYAVTVPSEVVVMENAIRPDTRGRTSVAPMEFEIVARGAYVAAAAGRYSLPPPDRRAPPDVQQARNAVAIARLADAARFAQDGLVTAERLLAQSEQLVASRASRRDIISQARASVQAAEAARIQSLGLRLAADQEASRRQAAAREQAAHDLAQRELVARRAAESERQRAEEHARAASHERERAEAARVKAERARVDAQALAARAEADRARAERDRASLRKQLLEQFAQILETRDTARGLVVNVGDVLFETGQYALRPAAREKLARFAGILLGHPGLSVQAEGFTDSTGSPAVNERLAQQRAGSVESFLLAQGLPPERVSARGYGAAHPVASNDTVEGRRHNRRVELVVTGDVIGTPVGTAHR